jgi:hypothetical protein
VVVSGLFQLVAVSKFPSCRWPNPTVPKRSSKVVGGYDGEEDKSTKKKKIEHVSPNKSKRKTTYQNTPVSQK